MTLERFALRKGYRETQWNREILEVCLASLTIFDSYGVNVGEQP